MRRYPSTLSSEQAWTESLGEAKLAQGHSARNLLKVTSRGYSSWMDDGSPGFNDRHLAPVSSPARCLPAWRTKATMNSSTSYPRTNPESDSQSAACLPAWSSARTTNVKPSLVVNWRGSPCPGRAVNRVGAAG